VYQCTGLHTNNNTGSMSAMNPVVMEQEVRHTHTHTTKKNSLCQKTFHMSPMDPVMVGITGD